MGIYSCILQTINAHRFPNSMHGEGNKVDRLGLLLLIIFLPLVIAGTLVIGRFMRNEIFLNDWIQAYGTITNAFPTGGSYMGIPQVEIMLKYEISGKTYEGCTTLLTRHNYYFPLGIVVPIRVNPKDLLNCTLITTKKVSKENVISL